MKFQDRYSRNITYTVEEALDRHLTSVDNYEYSGKIENLEEQVRLLRGAFIKLALLLPDRQLKGFIEDVTYMEQVEDDDEL